MKKINAVTIHMLTVIDEHSLLCYNIKHNETDMGDDDEELRDFYRSHAEYIERVRREWVQKASKEKPYDIFISYKDSDLENGLAYTADRVTMQDLYLQLKKMGYR